MRLIALSKRLHHGKVIRELHNLEVMLLSPTACGTFDQVIKKQHIPRRLCLTIAIPRRCAVTTNFSCRDFPLEDGEGFFELFIEVLPATLLPLGFRIMEVIDVDTFPPEIAKALFNLRVNITRSHTIPIDNIIRSG